MSDATVPDPSGLADSGLAGSGAPAAPPYDTIVAGAGVAGLTVAHDLAARGYRVLVLEAAERIGGTAAGLELDGLELDAGAESFAVRGGAVAELAGELGLADDIVDPNPAGAWLQLAAEGGRSRAVPLPKHTLLGIPSSPLARDVIDALGWGGALRAYADRLMPVVRIGTDDALGPLVRRRMGQKVLDRLVAPLAGGVYSADPEQLDLAVVAPGLNGGITRTGSLSGGVAFVLEQRAAEAAERASTDSAGTASGSAEPGSAGPGSAKPSSAKPGSAKPGSAKPGSAKPGSAKPGSAKPGSAVQGIRGGIHRIAERLAERATRHRAELRTGVRVDAIEETESGWLVTTDAGSHAASSLVVALPEDEARRLLAGLDRSSSGAAPTRSSSSGRRPRTETTSAAAEEPGLDTPDSVGLLDQRGADAPVVELVTLVFPPGAIQGDPRGTGVLVAADATGVRAKAMTHATAKWPWLREAAAGREIVRLSYGSGATGTGGAPATADLDDAAAAALALADARAIFGTELPEPVATARVRWQQGQPSSTIGAKARQQALRDAAAAHEHLLVVGAAVAGTGLAQVVPDARRAALEIRRERFAVPGTPWTDDIAPEEALDASPDASAPDGAADERERGES